MSDTQFGVDAKRFLRKSVMHVKDAEAKDANIEAIVREIVKQKVLGDRLEYDEEDLASAYQLSKSEATQLYNKLQQLAKSKGWDKKNAQIKAL